MIEIQPDEINPLEHEKYADQFTEQLNQFKPGSVELGQGVVLADSIQWVVLFCQEIGCWTPFVPDEIVEFRRDHPITAQRRKGEFYDERIVEPTGPVIKRNLPWLLEHKLFQRKKRQFQVTQKLADLLLKAWPASW